MKARRPRTLPGNFGTLDIIQALKWIRVNIESFGGDPNLVTITGELAGGFDVLSLLISPPARGLFQRAMSQSGAALTRSMQEADASSQGLLQGFLVKDGKARTPADAAALTTRMTPSDIRAYLGSKTDRRSSPCTTCLPLE